MPTKEARAEKNIIKINDRLPLSFKWFSGNNFPKVGLEECVFFEDIQNDTAKILLRRHRKTYIIGAAQAIPEGDSPVSPNINNLILLDDHYLYWGPSLATFVTDRSAGIRWAVTDPEPDRFEFDTGLTTRMFMSQIASGTDASLNFSPFGFRLIDSTSYSTNPSTSVYRGLDLQGTLTVGALAGAGGANLLQDPSFELWNSSSDAQKWVDSHLGSETQNSTSPRTGTYAIDLTTTGPTDGAILQSRPGGAPVGAAYLQLVPSTVYQISFYYKIPGPDFGNSWMNWSIWRLTNATDVAPAASLRGNGTWGAGESVCTQAPGAYPNFILTKDGAYHQFTATFTADPAGANPFYAVLMLCNGGSNNSGGTITVDDAVLQLPATNIVAPVKVRLLSEDSSIFKPQATSSGDSIDLTEFTGIRGEPKLAPNVASGATVTLTDAFGVYGALQYDASSVAGTFTLTNAYGVYGAQPTVGTNRWAGFFAGRVNITDSGSPSQTGLTLVGSTLTGSNAQSLVDLSQTWNTSGTPSLIKGNVTDTASNVNSKFLDFQISSVSKFSVRKDGSPIIPLNAGSNKILSSDSVGVGSWNSLSTLGIVTGTGTTNTITKWTNGAGGVIGDSAVTDDASTIGITSRNVSITSIPANVKGLTLSGGSLSGSNAQSLIDTSQTWNTTGVPSLILGNITDTASDVGSKFMDFQISSVSKFSVRKDGSPIIPLNAGSGKVLTSDVSGVGTWQTPASGSVGGSGTINTIPKWTAATTLGDSAATDNGSTIGITSRNVSITSMPANVVGLTLSGGSLSGTNAQSLVDISQAWSTTGTPTLFKVNVTSDTGPSNSSANLFDFQVGGTSRGNLSKNGALTLTPNSSSAQALRIVQALNPTGAATANTAFFWQPSGAMNLGSALGFNFYLNGLTGTFGNFYAANVDTGLVFAGGSNYAGFRSNVAFSGTWSNVRLGDFTWTDDDGGFTGGNFIATNLMGVYIHDNADAPWIGGTTAITNQYGLRIDQTQSGATNWYGAAIAGPLLISTGSGTGADSIYWGNTNQGFPYSLRFNSIRSTGTTLKRLVFGTATNELFAVDSNLYADKNSRLAWMTTPSADAIGIRLAAIGWDNTPPTNVFIEAGTTKLVKFKTTGAELFNIPLTTNTDNGVDVGEHANRFRSVYAPNFASGATDLTLQTDDNAAALKTRVTISQGAVGSTLTFASDTDLTRSDWTSGGIPYFDASKFIKSSALLAANQIVLGGGAGTTPATLGSLGTTTTVLHGNAAGAPSFSSITYSDLSSAIPFGQATVDFGAAGADTATVTVSDTGVTTTSIILVTTSYDPTGVRDRDELDMVQFELKVGNIVNLTSFDIVVQALDGPAHGTFFINYHRN